MVTSWALPTGCNPELRDAGVNWDAVRLPASLGDRVLAELGDSSGAVIRDQHVLYFLIRPGGADGWTFPSDAQVRVLGEGSVVVVPPMGCSQESCLCWARPVVNGRVLTRSRVLHCAMQAVIAPAVAQ